MSLPFPFSRAFFLVLFQVYNTILRRFPTKEYKAYADGGNLFSTTIAVVAPSLPLSLERYDCGRPLSPLIARAMQSVRERA